MATFDFKDIAEVLNLSRHATITTEATESEEGQWALYRGSYRVHLHEESFNVLWIYSKITKVALEKVMSRYNNAKTHLVHSASKGVQERLRRWRKLYGRVKGPYTPRDYLRSFMRDELETYVARMVEQAPQYYVDPKIEQHLRRPNPVETFLAEPAGEDPGALGIVLADPGQGKTYMSRHVVYRLAKVRRSDLVPVMVDATQWKSMPEQDLSDLWKTIVHSFRYHQAPIGWVEGHEEAFLDAACKADLFRIVFDGFDEFILRNRGRVDAMEVLEVLSDLAKRTGTRVVITSRSSFWNTNLSKEETDDFIARTGSEVFQIRPFDLAKARHYFTIRFNKSLDKEQRIARASQLYRALEQQNENLAGRGFVLNLVADAVERGDPISTPSQQDQILPWLMRTLCQREELRQELPLSAQEQMQMMQLFASTAAEGLGHSTEVLDLVLLDVRDDLDDPARSHCIEKFKSHPLLTYNQETDLWDFKEEQIGTFLLAQEIIECPLPKLLAFAENLELHVRPGTLQDLASTVVDILIRKDDSVDNISHRVRALSRSDHHREASSGPRLLASRISLLTVDTLRHQGLPKKDRTEMLLSIADAPINGLQFTGTIASYDFSGVTFSNCRFINITFARCEFDSDTFFKQCSFQDGVRIVRSNGFRSGSIEEACFLDADSKRWLRSLQVSEGERSYLDEDLRADINSVIDKFISKGGMTLKTVKEPDLKKGSISASPHQNVITSALLGSVLEMHHLSGLSAKGLNVRKEAVDAVRFYATNNVYTGPLQDVYMKLRGKLGTM